MSDYYVLTFQGQNTRDVKEIASHKPGGYPKSNQEIKTEAMRFIRGFCDERGFKIHYIRTWNRDGETVFDVGSHTEFFILRPEV